MAFGRFRRLLEDYPAHTLHETIPHFHDTPDRFRQFTEALDRDVKNRAKLLATADKRGIKENIEEIHDFSKINMVVPHNV